MIKVRLHIRNLHLTLTTTSAFIETKIYGYHMRGLSDDLKLAQVWVVYKIEQSVYIIKNAHGRTVMDLKECMHYILH